MSIYLKIIKKYKVFVVLFIGIAICILGIYLSIKTDNQNNEEPILNSEDEIIQEIESSNIFYEEDDDAKGYNYIINPEVLRDKGIYVVHIQDIPDEINRVLQSEGYQGEQVKIINAKQSGTKIKFEIVVLSDNKIKECEYSLRFGTFVVK